MLNGKVLDAYMEYFDQRSLICVDLLDKLVDTGEFDVYPYMEHCTFDIILGKNFQDLIKTFWAWTCRSIVPDTVMGTPGTAQQEGYKELVEWSRRYDASIIHFDNESLISFFLQSIWASSFENDESMASPRLDILSHR